MDSSARRDIPVSMRFREDDLALIDRAATSSGMSRTDFLCRAGLNEAKLAMINETVIRLSPTGFAAFAAAIEASDAPIPEKLGQRLSRPAPWAENADGKSQR